jgi:thiosulfate/3-mercaptopyruvate sulfurtransferase
VSELPAVVDVEWLRAHLGEPDLVLGDVRGPNAHARGHIPGSRPLVLGSPPPMSDVEIVQALASEVGLRLRRHGITGEERLVLYDRGDGVGSMPSAQLAELAGHPRVAVLLGGLAAWGEPVEVGPVELHPVKTAFEPRLDALPTRDELARRLDDPSLVLLDVRTEDEFTGRGGYPCDPRQGHIPGARRVGVEELFGAPGRPRAAEEVRALVELPEGADVVAYCHSGSRSARATLALRAAGYRARNYAGSWHEWSRHPELPLER